VSHEFTGDTEDLEGEFTGGRDDNNTGSCDSISVRFPEIKMTGACLPFLGLNLSECSISMAGIKKARVFPEPVFAAPRTSFPARRGGIPLA